MGIFRVNKSVVVSDGFFSELGFDVCFIFNLIKVYILLNFL